jgi:Sulfotransferase domain/N-terminal domain of galactosyltransferase
VIYWPYPANMSTPRIAFCTTCKGRAQHIKQTLPRNLVDNQSYHNCVFVLVDYASPDDLAEYVQLTKSSDLQSGRLVYYRYPKPGPFRMAHAKNLAHRLGILEGADILVNLDADNFTERGFAGYVAEQFKGGGNVFLWSRMVKDGPERTDRGISGRIAVTCEQFLNAGGYDEKFETWSPDDKDFNLRLQRLGYEAREIDRQYLEAVLHNDKMRFREYPHAASGGEDFEAVAHLRTTVANFGEFGCGVVYRNFGRDPIEMGVLPTRVFGIGMHKTGTTSLHTALTQLGFHSAHWPSAHWAKAVWNEMTTAGRSPTLERYYAVCDLPIPILFRELDRAYPGSKFILTTRSQERWIASVENHWSLEHNRFRANWDHDPFTNKAHKLLYGQKGFNRDLFLARYRRHNTEVLEHFEDRPDDLLVLDMESAGWPELCAFLKLQIPTEPYPKAFVTRRST